MTKLFAFIALLVLAGCTGPSPTPPVQPVPASPSEASAERAVQPEVERPEASLTLAQAIDIALANNPDVAAAHWDHQAAQARHDHIAGSRWPRLGVVGSYMRHLDEQRLLPVRQPGDPAILSQDIVSGDLVVTMPIFTGGRLIHQIQAAELLEEAAEHRLARNREELVFNVSSVFFNILAQRRVIQSLEFSVRTLQEHLDRVDALVAARKAANVDRLRTEVRLANVRQQLVQEGNVLAVQHRVLASLLGWEQADATRLVQGNLETAEETSVPELETALATACSDRADYLAAQSALEAQAHNVDAARAGRSPTVVLQGSYGGRWAAGSTTGTGDKLDDIGRIGLAMEIPIFEGGQINATVQEQRAHLAAARERLRKLELQIRLEIETALLSVTSSRKRIEAVRASIVQAREGLRIEQQKYDLGTGAIVDVLDAQAALLETETTYYRILAEFQTALAQLKLAMGHP
ncbi:TolC family protein [Anaerobaca lacustris]|uniref:TolC family protein n=1 Tax=Anaerobaca lacustris TaxID=3044600 RepID=A0AAW6U3Q2_9BACT|nr:TolC family protein [Sedimentisphaerales bacterium M17dextr]